ncbi:hypothetical protein [Cupriavidus sp. L7L]|uniref:hypothetical protein n=1 Tax=Cupriavidus sp. L7L TaxID=2546443 RepID=UPI00105461E5|nr:hypothetical protein [Cupriavidus sp. L7L]TDF62546.1 hypothetical protein E1J61_28915 [Cupriavidus sp. L7L]
MRSDRRRYLGCIFVAALFAMPSHLLAQSRLERDGVVLYWGLMPAAIVAQRHALEEMHGTVPSGGRLQHLVVALFRADGSRIDDAIVRAQLSETGIVDSPPKYLTPMTINGEASYGQIFTTLLSGTAHFRIYVKLPRRESDIEFGISASPQ